MVLSSIEDRTCSPKKQDGKPPPKPHLRDLIFEAVKIHPVSGEVVKRIMSAAFQARRVRNRWLDDEAMADTAGVLAYHASTGLWPQNTYAWFIQVASAKYLRHASDRAEQENGRLKAAEPLAKILERVGLPMEAP